MIDIDSTSAAWGEFPTDGAAFDFGFDLAMLDQFEVQDLTRALGRTGVAHRWEGSILAVGSEDCHRVEDLLREAGIDPRDVAGVATSVWDDPAGDDDVRYELHGWSKADKVQLSTLLSGAYVSYSWDSDVLVVPAGESELVEIILAQVAGD